MGASHTSLLKTVVILTALASAARRLGQRAGSSHARGAAGAFALIEGSTDAAVVVTLMPGLYTALARGKGSATGNVLVEVYDMQ